MKPYYQDDTCTIYHGDCREILPGFTGDVLITDPPYGVEFAGKAWKEKPSRDGGYTTDDDAQIGPEVVASVLPVVCRAAVFPGIRNMFAYPAPRDVGCVYVPAGAGIGPWGFVCFHPVLFYGKRPPIVGMWPASFTEKKPIVDKSDHPCPKPTRWLAWLVDLASTADETVLDPFMGSGTTLRAAKDLGRRAIGIEIEERYCEIAAKRLAQEVLALA